MCALESSGGGGTTTAGGSSSAGTSEVAGLTVQGTAPSQAEFVQEGSGSTTISGSTLNSVNVSGGSLWLGPGSAILRSVGALSIMRLQAQAFIDSFADGTVGLPWETIAGGGSVTETDDVLRLTFATGADARWGDSLQEYQVAEIHGIPFSLCTVIAHVKTATLDTPAAGSIAALLSVKRIGANVWTGLEANRNSAGTLTWKVVSMDHVNFADLIRTEHSSTAAPATGDFWWMLQINGTASGGDISFYYRTTAPTRADDTFTLLGTIANIGADKIRIATYEVEQTNSNGAVTFEIERLDIYPLLGPG